MHRPLSAALLFITTACLMNVTARSEETIVESINLPGASMEQEVTYSTTKLEYEAARDDRLKRLREGDETAFVNPREGPWMRVETTAKIGFEYQGVGAASGRKNVRQISAAEEALYRFQAK